MAKKIGIAVLLLLVVLGGVFYYFYSNAGSIIKTAIEHYGSEATKTAVRVSGVTLSLTSGEGDLSGLKIANPQGYSAGDAIELGDISVKVDPQSVLGTGPIVIRQVNIDHPRIAYEHSLSTSNLDALRSNVTAYGAKMSGGKSSGASSGQSRKIIIENLYVRNGTVQVSDAMLRGAAVSADLPLIHLSNIGRAKGGATQAEVAQQILSVITSSAIQVGAGALTKNLGSVGGAVGKAVPGGVTNSVKGLFGR
jgi:hypothetical protein